MKSIKTEFLIIILVSNVSSMIGQSGVLDSTFGNGGIVITDIIPNSFDFQYGATLQQDGKILTIGVTSTGAIDFGLVRYMPDGMLDESFGDTGIVFVDFAGKSDRGYAVIVQPDGKIVVAGESTVNNQEDFAIARYHSDGTPDSTFGTAGKVTTDLGTDYEFVNSLVLQPDGKIIAAGRVSAPVLSDMAVVRYNNDGTLDEDFGVGGIVITGVREEDEARAVALQPDGKIVLGGYASISAKGDYAVVRYNPDGTLDKLFGTGGKVTTEIDNSDVGYCMQLLPNGKILMGGITNYDYTLPTADVCLVQYNEDGTLDQSFGMNGKAVHKIGTTNDIHGLAIQPDGKIFVAGTSDVVNFEKRWMLARFLPDGKLDTIFGDHGVTTADFSSSQLFVSAALIQNDSRVVVVGGSGNPPNFDYTLARFIADFAMEAHVEQGITCFGDSNAVISLDVNGGVPPYFYSIDGGVTYQTSNVFTGLGAGSYTFTVRDSNGAGVTGNIGPIVVPDLPAPPAVTVAVIENDITIIVDGTGLYSYSIDGGISFQSENTFTDLADGLYIIVVNDENGCTIFNSVVMIGKSGLKTLKKDLEFEISPNPTSGIFFLKIPTALSATLQLIVADVTGRIVYSSKFNNSDLLSKEVNLGFLNNGLYQIYLSDGSKQGSKSLLITR